MACPVTPLVSSLTGRNRCLPPECEQHFRKQSGEEAKGMLSQHRLLRLFQQKAGEGAWRSSAPRPPTVEMEKPGPDKGGGLPLAQAPASLPVRLLRPLCHCLLGHRKMPVLQSYIPNPAYLCNKSLSIQLFFSFLSVVHKHWDCKHASSHLQSIQVSPPICHMEMMTTLKETTNPVQVARAMTVPLYRLPPLV